MCRRAASRGACAACQGDPAAHGSGGSRLPFPPASSSRGRWPPSALLLVGCHSGLPQGGASSPVCPYPSDSARLFRPPGAGTATESRDARDQSISSASPRRSSSARWRRSHTPASSCHSSRRRQSRSCPIRSPSPGGASPRECRCARRRQCRSRRRGPRRGGGRAGRVGPCAAGAGDGRPPRVHRGPRDRPWLYLHTGMPP